MDLAQLQALVQRSTLLSPDDRAYWLGALPTMSPQQVDKLENILSAGEEIHIEEKVKDYFAAVAHSAQTS